MTWVGKKSIDKKQKEFTSSAGSHEEAWRDINTQCHDFKMNGKRSILKRNEYTPLIKLVNAYLAAPFDQTGNEEEYRFNNCKRLSKFTAHVKGVEPEWEWTDATKTVRQFKEGSKWDKLTPNSFDQHFVEDFRENHRKGIKPKTLQHDERSRGCDSILRAVRSGILKPAIIKSVYKRHNFKLPDLTEFREVEHTGVAPVKYRAPQQEMVDKIFASIPELKERCIDTYLTFQMAYCIGLRWGEIRQARYSWFYTRQVNDRQNGGKRTEYVCEVQATEDWKPKAQSMGVVVISKDTYDEIMATKDRHVSGIKESPAEIQRLLWSMPLRDAAKQLGYSDVGLGKIAKRLGIPKPPYGFWNKVNAGHIPHPQGTLPEGFESQANVIALPTPENADERVLKRYRGRGTSASSANRRLARWFKDRGWDRVRVAHQMRAYFGAQVATETGSLYEAQNRLRHKDPSTTNQHYADLVDSNPYTVSFPKSA